MTKRETCEWAEPVIGTVDFSWCTWAPKNLPPNMANFIKVDRTIVFDSDCDRCPCWKQKETTDVE